MAKDKFVTVRLRAETVEALRELQRSILIRGYGAVPESLRVGLPNTLASVAAMAVAALDEALQKSPTPMGDGTKSKRRAPR